MLKIDNTVISYDIFDEYFLCDLLSCKGQCCVEGDDGAPLTMEEVKILENILPTILEFLPAIACQTIEKQGVWYVDREGEAVTTLVDGKECAFVYRDDDGCAKCAIEKAYKAGKIDFYKPISCHLYPVRLHQYDDFIAVNYHQWSGCKCARDLGKKKNIAVYQFLKEPLIRRFGEKWYEKLDLAAQKYYKK